MIVCVLSALRLCVWLSNNGYIQLLYMNERFLFTFWTEQGEIRIFIRVLLWHIGQLTQLVSFIKITP